MICVALIASLVIAADRFAKFLIFNNLFEGQSVPVIPNMLHLTLVLNTGAAFGILKNKNQFFMISSLVVIALIAAYLVFSRCTDLAVLTALGLILGGAIGNLYDRLVFGYIIDFLDFRVWPVFNIADSAITVGSALLVIKLFLSKRCSTR